MDYVWDCLVSPQQCRMSHYTTKTHQTAPTAYGGKVKHIYLSNKMVVSAVANAYKAGHTDKRRNRKGKKIVHHPLYESVLWKYMPTVAKFQHVKEEQYKSTSNIKRCVFLSSFVLRFWCEKSLEFEPYSKNMINYGLNRCAYL